MVGEGEEGKEGREIWFCLHSAKQLQQQKQQQARWEAATIQPKGSHKGQAAVHGQGGGERQSCGQKELHKPAPLETPAAPRPP